MITIEELKKCTVCIYTPDKKPVGTAFIILPDGHMFTCYHILEKSRGFPRSKSFFFSWQGQFLLCEFLEEFSDPNTDIAVLKASQSEPAQEFPFVGLGNWRRNTEIYSFVYQYYSNFEGFPIKGVIDGSTTRKKNGIKKEVIIINNTNIDSGSSGAPVFDTNAGVVVGIISEKMQSKATALAIPIFKDNSKCDFLFKENLRYSRLYHIDIARKQFIEDIQHLYSLSNYDVNTETDDSEMIVTTTVSPGNIKLKIAIWIIFTGQERVDTPLVEEIRVKSGRLWSKRDKRYINAGELISNKELTEEAANVIQNLEFNIEALTKKQLIESLINFSQYNTKIIKQYKDKKICKYYEDLNMRYKKTDEVLSMEKYFRKWVAEDSMEHSNILILGDYGTGKTSFCQKFAHDLAKQYENNSSGCRIPILINLKDYRKQLNIESVITNTLINTYKVNRMTYETFDIMNQAGLFILIYDGFDEMVFNVDEDTLSKNLSEIYRTIHPRNKVLLTARPECFLSPGALPEPIESGKFSSKPGFDIFYLKEFDDSKIDNVLRRRIHDEFNVYRHKINSTESLKELAYKPLFLDKIIATMPKIMEEQNPNIASIYRIWIEDFLKFKHDKGIIRLPRKAAKKILMLIAKEMHTCYTNTISEANINAIAGRVLNHPPLYNLPLQECVADIIVHTLLVLTESGYKFSHASFHYYFRAASLYKAIRDSDTGIFNVDFIGAETIFFTKDMLTISVTDTLLNWLKNQDIKVQKYAVILLGFIEENRGEENDEQLPVEKKQAITNQLRRLIRIYNNSKNSEEIHVKKHAQMSLALLGEKNDNDQLKKIIKEDQDYTHKWYTLLGVERLIVENKNSFNDFKEVIEACLKLDLIPAIRRLAEKILKHYSTESVQKN